jgi:drug/metabolite transporter (DMT)-like permease
MNNSKKSMLLTLLVILFWGTAATAFKIALKHTSPYNLLLYSSLFSSFILFGIIIIQKKWTQFKSINIRQLKVYTVSGFVNPFAYYIILFQAYDLLPGQIAMSLNYGWPIALALLSIPILKQPLTGRQIAAIFISFCGVLLISTKGEYLKFETVNLYGVFLALSSTVIWAVFWLFNVKDKSDPLIKLFYSFLFGTLYAFLFNYFYGDISFPNYAALTPVIYISFFEMGITFVLWMFALKFAPDTAKVGNMIFITPFLSLVFLNLVLGEDLYLSTFSGLVLIVAGIIFQKK